MPDGKQKIIAVPGVGNVEFPSTMSDDDIAAAISASQENDKTEAAQVAARPVVSQPGVPVGNRQPLPSSLKRTLDYMRQGDAEEQQMLANGDLLGGSTALQNVSANLANKSEQQQQKALSTGTPAGLFSKRSGLDLASRVTKVGAGLLNPQNIMLGAATAAAPEVMGPALIGHGLFQSGAGLVDMSKNGATPENTERTLFGGAEAAGGGIATSRSGLGDFLKQDVAPRLGNSAVGAKAKVIQNEANFGREPGRFIAQSPGIAGSSAETLPTNIQSRLNNIGNQISARVNSPQVASRVQNVQPQLDTAFNQALQDPITRGDTATVNAINDLKSRLTQIHSNTPNGIVPVAPRNLTAATPAELWQEKQYLGDNTKWSGTVFEKGQPLNNLRIKLYNIYKNAMETADPGIKTLNNQYAEGLTAKSLADAQAARVRTAPPGVGGLKKAAALGLTSTPVKTTAARLLGGKYAEPGPLPPAVPPSPGPAPLFQGPGGAPPNAAGQVTATGTVQNPSVTSIGRTPTGLRGVKTVPAGLLSAPQGPTGLLPERSTAPLITPPPGYSQGVEPAIVEQGYGVRRVANNASGAPGGGGLEENAVTASNKANGVKYYMEDTRIGPKSRVEISTAQARNQMKLGPHKRIIEVTKNGESIYNQ